nr:hypothetical protein [Tanacetum cinerariifolium]
MLVPQQVQDNIDAAVEDEDVTEPTPPSPTPATTPPPPQQELISSQPQVKPTLPLSPHQSPIAQPSSPPQQQPSQPSQTTDISMDLLNKLLETCTTLTRKVENLGCIQTEGKIDKLDADEDVTSEEVAAKVTKDADDDEAEPAKLKEVIEVVTTAKLMTEVVIATAATTITAALMPKASSPRRRREQVKRKEKQNNTVMRYQALKRKPITKAQARKNTMVYLKNMVGFKMDFFKGMTYTDIRPIFEKHFNSIVAFLEKGEKEIEEEASKIVPNDEDDVYTEATPLALKVPVVDYQIHTDHNKPYYKIIRADGTH